VTFKTLHIRFSDLFVITMLITTDSERFAEGYYSIRCAINQLAQQQRTCRGIRQPRARFAEID